MCLIIMPGSMHPIQEKQRIHIAKLSSGISGHKVYGSKSRRRRREKKKPINYQGTPTTSAALLHNKKSTQDIFEDDSMEEQRMRLKTQGKQLWCQLDLSGQGLVNISSKLFHYDF